jgi:hypothetical protein
MRGMDNLRKMRISGMKPCMVWVELMPMQKWTHQYTSSPGASVDIHMDDADIARIGSADLRPLIGLTVLVNGEDNDKTERVARECFKAGANVVQAVFYDLSNPYKVKVVKGLRISKEGEKTVWQQ